MAKNPPISIDLLTSIFNKEMIKEFIYGQGYSTFTGEKYCGFNAVMVEKEASKDFVDLLNESDTEKVEPTDEQLKENLDSAGVGKEFIPTRIIARHGTYFLTDEVTAYDYRIYWICTVMLKCKIFYAEPEKQHSLFFDYGSGAFRLIGCCMPCKPDIIKESDIVKEAELEI